MFFFLLNIISPTIAPNPKSISTVIVVLSPVFGGTGGFTTVLSFTVLFFSCGTGGFTTSGIGTICLTGFSITSSDGGIGGFTTFSDCGIGGFIVASSVSDGLDGLLGLSVLGGTGGFTVGSSVPGGTDGFTGIFSCFTFSIFPISTILPIFFYQFPPLFYPLIFHIHLEPLSPLNNMFLDF